MTSKGNVWQLFIFTVYASQFQFVVFCKQVTADIQPCFTVNDEKFYHARIEETWDNWTLIYPSCVLVFMLYGWRELSMSH